MTTNYLNSDGFTEQIIIFNEFNETILAENSIEIYMLTFVVLVLKLYFDICDK